jgi:hypothetical protein
VKIRVAPLDIAAFGLALAIVALVSARVYARAGGEPAVHLRGPHQEWIFPLDSERTVAVPGPLGDTVVQIRQGQARVLSSPCPEKICLRSGAIARPGQWIACLPNRVFIDIQAGPREAVDAYSF